MISEVPVFLPPISEQGSIVKNIENLSAEVKSIEAIFLQKITALNELKQSLLQKAFSGELPTDMAGEIVEAAE